MASRLRAAKTHVRPFIHPMASAYPSALSKVFAVTAGLAPSTPRLDRLFGRITLETGLAVGGAFFVIGAGLLVFVFATWARMEFGDLQTGHKLRLAIPGATATAIGLQVMMSSFLLSRMGMARH